MASRVGRRIARKRLRPAAASGLEDSRIPTPDDPNSSGSVNPQALTQEQLLAFLPKMGTIGQMWDFLYGFSQTDTYESFIPQHASNFAGGPDTALHPFFGPNAAA